MILGILRGNLEIKYVYNGPQNIADGLDSIIQLSSIGKRIYIPLSIGNI